MIYKKFSERALWYLLEQGKLIIQDQGHALMTSFIFSYFIRGPCPKTATLGIWGPLYEFGGGYKHVQSKPRIYTLKEGEELGCLCLHSRKIEVILVTLRVKCLLLEIIDPLNNSNKGQKSHRNQRLKPKFPLASWELESH